MTPGEVVACIEVAVFLLMGLVVIPLVWSYLRKGKQMDVGGASAYRENWLRPGEKLWVKYEMRGPAFKVDEEWFREHLEQYEERKKRSQPSQ